MLVSVTIASLIVAVTMTLIAWRASAETRRRSAARVAALSEAIHAEPASLFAAHGRAVGAVSLGPAATYADLPLRSPASRELFATSDAGDGRRSRRIAAGIALGVLVVGAAAALTVVAGAGFMRRPDDRSSVRVQESAAEPSQTVAGQPLPATATIDLVALGHERDGDGLIVRGAVRNPSPGSTLDRVTAVVFLFNHDGGFITSARAALDQPTLAPGGESAFRIAVADAANVSRYRVSFRTDDRVIPHVDRRGTSQQVTR